MATLELYADEHRGIFIPQFFAESYNPAEWEGIDPENIAILKAGPNHEWYWEAWDSVLGSARTKDGRYLYQDGDLWVGAENDFQTLGEWG